MKSNTCPNPEIPGCQIREQIYQSIHSLVYQGIIQDRGQPVIIKVLRNPNPTFNNLVQFRNQYIITRDLEHPGIIQTLALERYGNGYALIMADNGAIALGDYWQQDKRSLREFLTVAIQLAEALHYLSEQHILHKDIKPANILIHPQTKQVKLIDFSISSLLSKEQQQLINPSVLEGTLAYISPEQTGRMNRGIDYRTDFYSLGVTFFELLTGELPFASNDPMELIHCHIAKIPSFPHTQNLIPNSLKEIVMKLMAKNAEDRYQSALGLKYDLESCLQQLETTGEIGLFELGKRDVCDRFLIPEKLYGRETEVQRLLDTFNQIATGKTELMLVAGFSGIGKTAVINEVHKPIIRQRGYFIKGKFDQFNRNIPFSAFVQAFRDLIKQLFGESDAGIAIWKSKILDAVGGQGQVIIDVIPELEQIIGQQQPVAELSGSAAQNRFNLLFGKFVRVFTTKEHPLVIFLDDLQWADSASLKLLKLLTEESETGYLLILGAYRDNEVSPAHSLMLTLTEIEKNKAAISTITLQPLGIHQINQLVADTLNCRLNMAQPLSELIYQKTKGNPFFTTQFLQGLHEDKLITFNNSLGYWECDLVRVQDAALTDDVVEFMVRRLQKLPQVTQNLLKLAACIGNQFDLETLSIIYQKPQEEVAADIWGALQEGLVLPMSEAYKFFQGGVEETAAKTLIVGYRFLHDRVQQAAYSLIPEQQRQITHYHIGQLLLQKIPLEEREDRIFELVNQLNYGKALIAEQTERDELAHLNLIACHKAKTATAYQAGLKYASIGLSLLGKNAWQQQYATSLEFHELAAELASLCGDFEVMEEFIETVTKNAHSLLEQVDIYRIRIFSNVAQNNLIDAITIAQQFLQQFSVNFPEAPTQHDIQQAIVEVRQLIGDRNIEDLAYLPTMENDEKLAIIKIANSIIPATHLSGSPLFSLLVALSVKLSIQYGNTSSSAYAYATYGLISCNLLPDVDTGVKFGQLALRVLSKLDDKTVKPKVLLIVGLFTFHRKSHIKKTLPLLQEGYTSGLEAGNQEFAGYSAHGFCCNSFWCGQSLITLEQETRVYCNGLVQLSQLTTANYCRIYWQSILNLLGFAECPSILTGEVFQEAEYLPQMLKANDLYALYIFYVYKLMLSYLFEENESAQILAVECRRYPIGGVGTVNEPAFYFYDSLVTLAKLGHQSEETSKICQQVEQNQRQLQNNWVHYAPVNYQHKVDLVEAEKFRVLGERYKAADWYDRAIAGAKENEYIQEEALANELAAKFYLNWGKEKIAAVYMQEAYYCYARWGAKAKTEHLEAKYPQLLASILQQFNSQNRTNNFTQASIISSNKITNSLDLETVIKASQTVSEEIELDALLSKLMHIVTENAGADQGALILNNGEIWEIVAQCDHRQCHLSIVPLNQTDSLPKSIIHTVIRTQKPEIINNLKQDQRFVADPYLLQHPPKSLCCTPILNQGQLIGILYLENNLTLEAFTPERITILNFLTSQAAISIENARLYENLEASNQTLQQHNTQLQDNQRKLSQILEAMPIGVVVHNPGGEMTFANEKAKELLQVKILPETKTEQLSTDFQVYQAETNELYPTEKLPFVRSLAGEIVRTEDIELHYPNQIIPLEVSSSPIRDRTDEISQVIGRC